MKKNYLLIVAILICFNMMAQQTATIESVKSNFSRGWLQIYNGFYWFDDCFFIDQTTGYVVGNDNHSTGVILKTMDGGATWSDNIAPQIWPIEFVPYHSVHFMNSNLGYVVGWNGNIIKTTDGGSTWDSQVSGTSSALTSIFFVNANIGYIVGWDGTILKTTNGGTTWNSQVSGTSNILNSIYFVDSNTGFIGGDNGTMLKTTNGGITWNIMNSGTTSNILSIDFPTNSIGYAACNVSLFKTINGGVSWNDITPMGLGLNFGALDFINENLGFVVGVWSSIVKTTNGGITFTTESSGGSKYLNSVQFLNENIGYTVGSDAYDGIIWKRFVGVGIHENNKSEQVKIFPNPTSGKVTIKSNKTVNNLMVYNSMGVIVKEIIELNKNQCDIDLSDQPKGIYSLRFSIDDKVIIRMVVLI